jgi:hypothetical protein
MVYLKERWRATVIKKTLSFYILNRKCIWQPPVCKSNVDSERWEKNKHSPHPSVMRHVSYLLLMRCVTQMML